MAYPASSCTQRLRRHAQPVWGGEAGSFVSRGVSGSLLLGRASHQGPCGAARGGASRPVPTRSPRGLGWDGKLAAPTPS